MKKLIFILTICMLLSTSFAFAATVADPVITEYVRGDGVVIRDIYWKWTSSDGSATATGGWVHNQSGQVWKVIAEPDAANQPDDLYDITLPTEIGRDILSGYGANLPQSATATTNVFSPLNAQGDRIPLVNQDFYFSGANLNAAGVASGGFHLLIEVWTKKRDWF